jgi:putative transcriptional regulator
MTATITPLTMPFKWRLKAVMADRDIDNKTLQTLTGLHETVISQLRNNLPKRLDIQTLEKLCSALKCQPGELLIWSPNEEA